jgi:hypothetical protein
LRIDSTKSAGNACASISEEGHVRVETETTFLALISVPSVSDTIAAPFS